MKKLIKALSIFALLTLTINSVVSQYTANFDKTVDFTKFKTYEFGGWQNESDKLINDIDKNRLHQSFKQEFSNRGITGVAQDGDMLITLYFVVDNKTSTTAYTNYTGGMGYGMGYGRRYGAGWGWGMGSSTTTFQESDYQVGTLVVDCYDKATKKLLWQGVAQGTIGNNTTRREKSIPRKVKKLMKKYPVKAG